MNVCRALIGEFLNDQQKKGLNYEEGISEEILLEVEKSLYPYKFSEDLLEFYRCCNGSDDNERMLCYSNFLSLNDAAATYNELISTMTELDLKWPMNLFPIGIGDGSYLLVKIYKCEKRPASSEVFYFDIGGGDLDVTLEVMEFSQLLKIIIEVDKDTYKFKNASDKIEEIRRKLCPDAFFSNQKGMCSPSGFKNVYDLGCDVDFSLISKEG